MVFLSVELHSMRNDANANQAKLYSLMKGFAGHVWSNDLKEDGRRLGIANRFLEQLNVNQDGLVRKKELLKHGIDGITAYIDLSDRELMTWIHQVPSQSKVYADLLKIRVHAPIIDANQLVKTPINQSNKENAEELEAVAAELDGQ